MKNKPKRFLMLGMSGVPLAAPYAEPAAADAVIPKKTIVQLELLQNLNSKLDRTGAPVRFTVSDDVLVDGHVVIAKGTAVQGRIKFAEPSRSNGRAGTLQIVR